jgi:hypothetical protein
MKTPDQLRPTLGVEKLEDRLVPDGTSPIVYDVRNAFGNLQINDPWQVSVQDPAGNSLSQGSYNTAIDGNQNLNGYMTAPDPEVVTLTPSYVVKATSNGYQLTYSNMPEGMKSQVTYFGMGQTDQNGNLIYHSQNVPKGSGVMQVALPWLNNNPRVYQVRLFDSINGIASARIIATNFYQNRIENQSFQAGKEMDDSRYTVSQPLSDVTTLMGVNVDTTNPHNAYSMTWNPNTAVLHPGPEKDVVLSWKSPGPGTVDLKATLKDSQLNLGDGVTVSLEKKTPNGTRVLASGMVAANGTLDLTRGTIVSAVSKDDLITLKVTAKGSNGSALNSSGDATETAWTVSYTPGPEVSPQEILLRETAQDIADSLLATGQSIDALRTAVAEGTRTEQWELDAWHAYVERVRTYGPVSPLELEAAIAGESAQQTETTLWSYVDASLADAAQRLSMNRDTVSLAGAVTGPDTNRPSVSLALAHLGGTASLSSLKGSLPFARVSLVSGTDVNRALGSIDTLGAAPASIAAASGIANGQVSGDFRKTMTVNGLGTVTIEVDTGVRDYSYSQVAPIHKIRNASNTLASTQEFPSWQQNIDYGYVKVQLDGAKYVSNIDVTRLTPSGSGALVVTLAEGTERSFPVSGSGSIRVDNTITKFTLYSQSGAYGLQDIDTRTVTPATGWENMTDVRKLEGTAAMLDLTGAGKLVTSVSGKVGSQDPTDVITAHVYRGEQKVESIVIGVDGLLSLQNPEGISSVVLTHTNLASPLFVGGVTIETDGTAARTDWVPLSNASNAQLSQLSAPRWVTDVPFNYIDVGRSKGVLYRYGGQSVQINGMHKEGATNTDPSKYHRVEVRMMGSGSVAIKRVLYINAGGLFEVPPEYYTLMGSAVIIHPGAPEFIALEMQGTGYIEAPYYAAHGAAAEDVMPASTPNFDANWLQWQAQPHDTEGWTDVPSGVVNSRVVAVPGSTLGTLWQIRNDGLQAGEVTVKVHVGQAGSSTDPVQKIFTGVIGPMQSRALAFNVGIAHERDTVSLEIIRPDGTSFQYGHTTSAAHSNETRRVNPVTGQLEWVGNYSLPGREDQIRIARLYIKVAESQQKPSMRAAAEALLNATTPEAQLEAYTALTKLPISSVAEGRDKTFLLVQGLINEDGGIGGNPNTELTDADLMQFNTMSPKAIIGEIANWYSNPNSSLTVKIGNNYIRTDTVMGRAYLGLYQNMFSLQRSEQVLWSKKIAYALGIKWGEIIRITENQLNYQEYAKDLEFIFRKAGFDTIFSSTSTPQTIDWKNNFPISADNVSYKNGKIRVRWDVSLDTSMHISTNDILRIDAYLVDALRPGNIKLIEAVVGSDSTGVMYLDIPVQNLNVTPEKGDLGAQLCYIRAVIWMKQITDGVHESIKGNSSIFSMDWDGKMDVSNILAKPGQDLSTLLNIPENRDKREYENAVLNILGNHFRNNLEPGNWVWTHGSEHHHDGDFAAMDLNIDGKNDYGTLLHSIGTGTIVQVGGPSTGDLSLGEIKIEHKINIPGQGEKVWVERHYHLPLEIRILTNSDGSIKLDDQGKVVAKVFSVRRTNAIDPTQVLPNLLEKLKNGTLTQADLDVQNNYDRQNPIVGIPLELTVGKTLTDKQGFAYIGESGAGSPHDHLSVRDQNGVAIDTQKLMTQLVQEFKAGEIVGNVGHIARIAVFDIGRYIDVVKNSSMSWEYEPGKIEEELWYSEEFKLAFSRGNQLKSGNPIEPKWIAWSNNPSERKEVKWYADGNGWFAWNSINKTWARNTDNKLLKWTISSNPSFIPQSQ